MTIDGWILLVVAAVEIVNICLLLGLLYVYWGSYKEAKSKFSIGLLFFASTFLLKSVLFVILLAVFMLGGFGEIHEITEGESGGGLFWLFLLNIIECIALAILFRITWE